MGAKYTAVVLDEPSVTELKVHFSNLWYEHLQPAGYTDMDSSGNHLPHHMTMNMGPCRDNHRDLLGQVVSLEVDAWAVDGSVMAVRVSNTYGTPCDNATPHITMCVNYNAGGRPAHSNNLTNWVKMPARDCMSLFGTVTEIE